MPQTNATYDAADANEWFSTIDGAFEEMREAWEVLKAWRPNSPEVLAMGAALTSGCTACNGLKTEAYSRLGTPAPPNSGGTPKFA